jgi:predicted transglutaminase-like cysteine proteinase
VSVFVQGVRILSLLAVICAGDYATANPNQPLRMLDALRDNGRLDQPVSGDDEWGGGHTRSEVGLFGASPAPQRQHARLPREPFGLQSTFLLPSEASEMSAKWIEVQSRIGAEAKVLAACRSGSGACSLAARRFLSIVELGRGRQGRARFGEINRAINLSIRPVSDWVQYGVADYWSAPLATFSAGAGDCEDYAIAKYVALSESGVALSDLRLVIVHDMKRHNTHAVVAVRHDRQWLILDNRTLIMVSADQARHYSPMLVLDQHGVTTPGVVGLRR